MRKLIIILLITIATATTANAQSHWEIKPNQEMTLNYNLLGRHYAQGAWYGAGGYGLGMWLSGNRTEWGIIASVLAVNIPILLEDRYNEPETVIGRNLGALTIGVSATFAIEYSRKGLFKFALPSWLKKY